MHSKNTGSLVGYPDKFGKMPKSWWFQVMRFTTKNEFHAPQWFPVALAAMLGTLPWIRRPKRFSLRTLLIATTIIGLLLGLIIATTR
jgi:hypothetical protein